MTADDLLDQPGGRARHERMVGDLTIEHACAILASATRAGLHQLSGEDPDHRLMTLAAFLYHLCQVEPERREKMRALLDAVAESITEIPEHGGSDE